MTDHQRGLIKQIVRGAAETMLQENYADRLARLVEANLKSNDDLFEILGQFDNWGEAKEALKILKGEKKVCISEKSGDGRAVRTTSR